MKPILGVVAVLSWLARCQDVDLPNHHPHPHSHGHADAGVEPPPEDAGRDAAIEVDAAVDASDHVGPELDPCQGPPGLYVDANCEQVDPALRPYRPAYELWSDGASKQRYIYLPPGTRIDASNPDRWTFPVGTRLYKTFSVDGLRIETRVMEKLAAEPGVDSWSFVAYAWSGDQRSVSVADPAIGVPGALGTDHDIPTQAQCKTCHTMTTSVSIQGVDAATGAVVRTTQVKNLDAVNGFEAIQLNHGDTASGVTLRELLEAGLFSNGSVDTETARLPGDATARAALGYLHANCGHCHGGASPRANLNLSAKVGMTVQTAPAVTTGMCACLGRWTGRKNVAGEQYARRILAGDADVSGIVGRMRVRGMGEQMPPLGTKRIDTAGVEAVSKWIDGLDPGVCGAAPACAPPAAPMAPMQAAAGAPAPTAAAGAPAPAPQ